MIKSHVAVMAAGLLLLSLPVAALAKKPHPAHPDPAPEVDSCECSVPVMIPDSEPAMYESYCDVQWTTTGASWSTYGASVEFEAEWTVEDVEMSSESEADIDDYSCVFETDETCTAIDVLLVISDFADDADIEFEARVKGFDTKGPRPRNFVKSMGDCSFTE